MDKATVGAEIGRLWDLPTAALAIADGGNQGLGQKKKENSEKMVSALRRGVSKEPTKISQS